MKLFVRIALVFLSFCVSAASPAQATNQCQAVVDLAYKLNCAHILNTTQGAPQTPPREHFISKDQFGPSECLSNQVLTAAVSELKSQCDTWLATQKSQLADRFVTGTCSKRCEPCPNGQEKCTYLGEVHYKFENKTP
jgi:hypothetical protein